MKAPALISGLLVFLCASAAVVRLTCSLTFADAAERQHIDSSLKHWSACFQLPALSRDCWAVRSSPGQQGRGHRKALYLDAAFILPDATTAVFILDSQATTHPVKPQGMS